MSSDPLRVALLLALIGRLRADLPPADVRLPCRGCGAGWWPGDGVHVYGERKCCPDCDHRG